MKAVAALLVACGLTLLSACELLHLGDHNSDWGQRFCPETVTCTKLVELACGEDDRCAGTLSCEAARRLDSAGVAEICHTAWCDLGESYRECGLLE